MVMRLQLTQHGNITESLIVTRCQVIKDNQKGIHFSSISTTVTSHSADLRLLLALVSAKDH